MPKNKVGDLIIEEQRRLELRREQVLDRLWEIAKMGPEIIRGSITGQIKALAMIVAMEGLIPDRRAAPSTPPRGNLSRRVPAPACRGASPPARKTIDSLPAPTSPARR
jgi:hypothetical protein